MGVTLPFQRMCRSKSHLLAVQDYLGESLISAQCTPRICALVDEAIFTLIGVRQRMIGSRLTAKPFIAALALSGCASWQRTEILLIWRHRLVISSLIKLSQIWLSSAPMHSRYHRR